MVANAITGEFNKILTLDDFQNEFTKYDGITPVYGVPVTLYYRVLPGNSVAFGAGATSYGGVRSAYRMQISPVAVSGEGASKTSTDVPCEFRLIYMDPNRVRQLVIMDSFTEFVKMSPVDANGVSNQFNFLPESANDVGAFSFLAIQLIPTKNTDYNPAKFSAMDTKIHIPVTITTYATASGV